MLRVRNAGASCLHAVAPPVELLAIGYCASFGLASAQVRHALQTRVLAAHLLLGLEAIVDRVEDELRLDLDEHKQRPLHLPPPTIPKAA